MTIKQLYPTSRPSLDLNFAASRRLDPRITYSRASSGTYFDSTGTLQSAAINQARFDHDPTTGESLGLLVEEARTNVLLRSEEFDDVYWGNSNATVFPNQVVAPDGTFTAGKLIGTGNNPFIQRGSVGVNGQPYSLSVFAKKAELSWLRLVNYTSANNGAWFDLNSGTVGTVIGAGNTAEIESIGNGWYKCTLNIASFFSNVSTDVVIACTNADNTTTGYTGDGSSGIYIWGAQLEAGSFPTSYIPTPATFTSRSTTATYYDASGVIQTAGIDVARDNAYFPDENGVFKPAGLLLEAAGTNYATWSNEIGAGKYLNKINSNPITLTNNATTAPDGTLTAATVTGQSDNYIYSGPLGSLAAGDRCVSCYLKALSTTTSLSLNKGSGGDSGFNLNISTLTTSSFGTSFVRGGYEKLPNNWYRLWAVFNYAGDWDIRPAANGDYALWGFQFEYTSYPTSVIPTAGSTVTRAADVSTSATVTRSADVAQITGTNFSSWYNQSEGTVLVNLIAKPGTRPTNNYTGLAIKPSAGPWADANLIGQNTDVNGTWYSWDSGVYGFQSTSSLSVNGNKIAWGLSPGGSSSIVVDQIVKTTTWGFSSGLTRTSLSIGTDSGGSFRWKRLTYYPVRLPDATLQTLTS